MTKLQAQRIKNNLTQAELARRTGASYRIIQQYEEGIRPIEGARIKTLLMMSKVLNCKIADLIEDEETLTLIFENHI